ncbi:MAG TPA: purine nucleoside permease [Caulobacteraceae bacterium]|jgi:purine nucleoside permease|nr:purine nucleoside permease [Caulobacteraceae bacterium]
MKRFFALLAVGLALASACAAQPAPAPAPVEIRVVVITTWEAVREGRDVRGELSAWRAKWPLTRELPFPAGVHPLLFDPQRHVLAIVTGMASARAAASVMALGLDPRFELSRAYWVLAGTAGVDPAIASAGSVAWERYVVEGDIAQEVDARDIPAGWPTGMVPDLRTTPYAQPPPPAANPFGTMAYHLDPRLVDWAYGLTRGVALGDDATLARARALYSGPGAAPPFVLEGDGLMSARFWSGPHMTDWARRWVPYWTGGKGVFAMSAEEDAGVMQALTQLSGAGRVRLDRVLMLRGASDYVVGPPGESAADQIARQAKEGLPANAEALDGLYAVASPVVRYLAEHWATTRETAPGR